MRTHAWVAVVSLLAGAALGALGALTLRAEEEPFTRRLLVEADLERVPGKRVLLMDVRLAGGASTGKHTHPGQEFACVIEGEGVLEIEGRDPLAMKAGTACAVPDGAVHCGRNASATAPLRLIVALVVDKDQPPVTPVAEKKE